MKVILIDNLTPRTDGKAGRPHGVTLGKEYEVAEVLDQTAQYSIINDENKMARYSQSRFEVTNTSPVLELRANFNRLTTPMRSRIKELERILEHKM